MVIIEPLQYIIAKINIHVLEFACTSFLECEECDF